MANTFKYGSGVWATKKGSSLAYNDQDDNYKPLPFTTDRASTATRVNKEGLIEVVGQDKLRIDYTDSTKGVALLEPSRTNLLPYSNDFTNAAYTKTRCTVTANQAISPDGTQNADLMTATGDDARLEDVVGTAGQSTTMSVYVKSATGSDVEGQIDFSGANIVTFTATNEWQRIETTLTTLTITPRFRVRIDNDGDSLYVFGGQVEYGSYGTSHIPTSGSSVTRVADTANGAGNSEVFNDSEGVLYVDIATEDDGLNKFISIGDADDKITIYFYTSINDSIRVQIRANNVAQALSGVFSGYDIETFNRIVLQYKSDNTKVYINGFQVASATGLTMPSGLNELAFDSGSGADDFYGKVKGIKVYDTALSDADLEYLTSYRSLTEMATELNLNTL